MFLVTKWAASVLPFLNAMLFVAAFANAAESGNRVTVVAAADRRQPIVAKIDAEGTIHLLCDAADGPWYAKSTDGGVTWSASMPVVDAQSRRPGLEFKVSDMAVGKGGRIHVAMSTNAWKLKLPKEEWGFFYASLDAGAKAFSPVRNVNRKPSEGFSLAADDKGNVTACWLSDKLYANVSRDNGKTFSPNVEIDPTYNPCNCCTTSAAYGADGKLAVLYREETNNQRDMFLVLWDQTRNRCTIKRVSGTPWSIEGCPMTYYMVARNEDGFTAIWPTKGDVYFVRLDGQGNALSPGEIKTPGTTGMRTGALVLNAPDGSTLTAWKKDGQLGWQLYDTDGQPSGRPGAAASPGNGVAGVVSKDGEFILFR